MTAGKTREFGTIMGAPDVEAGQMRAAGGWGAGVPRWFLTLLVFLAPLKFGTSLGIGEIRFFPMSGWDWVFGPWPSFLLPVGAGLGLLLTLLFHPRLPGRSRLWLVPGAWSGLLVFSLVGLLRTSEWEHALLFVWHILGVACCAVAVFWCAANDGALPRWLLNAVVAGMLFCCIDGWRQRFGGLEATREFAATKAEVTGHTLPAAFHGRLQQQRVFGPFVYPNSFAAHLILGGALFLVGLWGWAGRFEPVRVSRALFFAAGGVLLAGALLFTGSRAALVALAAGLGVGVLTFPALRRFRWLLLFGCMMAALLVLAVAKHEGKMLSLAARGQYYRAALTMFASRPLTGVGLGEFFPHYMRLKPPGAEETRLPHNMLLNLASQAGLFAAVAGVICLSIPLAIPWLTAGAAGGAADVPGCWLRAAVVVGLVAWGTHSLADFNLQIPGTVTVVGCLPAVLFRPGAPAPRQERQPGFLKPVLLLAALIAIAGAWRLPGEYRYQLLFAECEKPDARLPVLRDLAEAAGAALPFSPYPYVLLGRAAQHAQDPRLAVTAYIEAARRAPHRSAIHSHLAENYLVLGDLARAREAAGKALLWYPGNRRNRALARVIDEML